MGRIRYNRGNLEATVAAAKKVLNGQPLYVFATANGFTIDKQEPPFGQRFIMVLANGEVKRTLGR